MAKLSSSERAGISSSEFALPSQRKFPIENRGHAEAALIDVNRSHISPAEKAEVKRKARAKLHDDVPMGRLDA